MTPSPDQTPQKRQDGAGAPLAADASTVALPTRPGVPHMAFASFLQVGVGATKRRQVGGTVCAHGETLR